MARSILNIDTETSLICLDSLSDLQGVRGRRMDLARLLDDACVSRNA